MSLVLPPYKDWYMVLEQNPLSLDYLNQDGRKIINPNLVSQILAEIMLPTCMYSTERETWFHFDNKSWVDIETVFMIVLKALEEIRGAFRQRLTNEPQLTRMHWTGFDSLLNNTFVKSVISNLESMPHMYCSDLDFDSHKTLMNTPGGLYDLATHLVIPNASGYKCRNLTRFAPEDDEDGKKCPEYLKHLNFITEGRQDLIAYIEALSGYMLTGETFMQEFYWFQGIPKTGKSALADIWFHLMGDYSEIAYKRQFAEVQNEQHTEQDYRLIGKRLIYTDEPKVNTWDEEKLKGYTGSTPVAARPMYGSGINFYPAGKLLFTSNDKPQINGADEGVGRRLRLIPFTRVIPEAMRNRCFAEEKLYPEAPYILYRMMRFAKQVLRDRNLPECPIVTEMSKSYMQENDILRQFVSDCCTTEMYDTSPTKILYTAFTMWCNDNSYDCPSQNKFGRMLSAANYELSQQGGKRLRTKIKLNDAWAKKAGMAPVMSMYN